jgi:uncharacterized membrane protein
MRRTRIDVDLVIGYVLLGGVLTSMALLATGVAWHDVRTGELGLDYRLGGTTLFGFVVLDLQQLVAGEFRPRLLVNLGIAVLMLTPYARVLASMLYFGCLERNWKYTAITAFVLAVLTYSLFLR